MRVERNLFMVLRAESRIAEAEANGKKRRNQSDSDFSKLMEMKKTRRRLNRELKSSTPLLALGKAHINHLRSAEYLIEANGADAKNGHKRYSSLTGIEIGNQRLKKAIDRVNKLTERYSAENAKSSDIDREKQKNIIKLTALEAEALRRLAQAGNDIVPTKELTELVREWRRKSHNANYNLISALKLRLTGSGIRIENELRKGYRLIDPSGKIGKFLESTEIIPDPLLIKRMEVEKIQQETANTEATCMSLHLQGKTVEAIAGELKLPVNRVKALIVSAELKSKLGL